MSIVQQYKRPKEIKAIYKKEVENWDELKAIDEFLERFKNASPNEVLSNALELKGLVKSLKDSIKPVFFDVPALNSRINIFQNETLRLADMTKIPAIKANEVSNQSKKVINSYSMINSKINTMISKKRFQDEIKVDVKFIGLDSTKIDSISKNTIKNDLEEKKINKEKVKKAKKFKPRLMLQNIEDN